MVSELWLELWLLHLFVGEVVNPSQDLCSPYHVSSSDNSSLNRVYSLITQQGGDKRIYLLNIQSREIFVSRDVVFYEHVFPYQRVQDTSNETNSPDINDQILFAENQSVLSQPSQVILAPCDNVENSSDNNCESQIEVLEEDCSHIDQNLNENHDIEQSSESDPSV